MKEYPILFVDFLARAISMGIKTQTRRPRVCPYIVGQKLWVRESWQVAPGKEYTLTTPEYDGGCNPDHIIYKADDPCPHLMRWRSPLFIPKWAARRLEITDVRKQRLQDITEEEAIKEGSQIPIRWIPKGLCATSFTERAVFGKTWNYIYRKNPELQWSANPEVWMIEFRRT